MTQDLRNHLHNGEPLEKTDEPMLLTYVGAHYTLCPVEVRELWTATFDTPDGRRELADLASSELQGAHGGFVPVFTCNRFDIVVYGLPDQESLLRYFSKITQIALHRHVETDAQHAARKTISDLSVLRSVLHIAHGRDAVAMLFRIASSLDSLVLGEPHILGQLKEQYLIARDLQIAGSALEPFFSRSFAVAKRVRTETDLGRSSVSIGHAAVFLASRIFEKLSGHSALVMGAGEMGRLTAQHLLAQGLQSLTICNRTLARAEELVRELGAGKAESLTQTLNHLHQFDIIIVATGSRKYLISPDLFHNLDRERKGQPMVVVDISVPRNVDPRCAASAESLFLFDVDDLDKVMEQNREQRREAALHAERLIAEDLAHFSWQQARRSELQTVGNLHQLIRSCVTKELEKAIHKGHNLEAGQPGLNIIANAIAKKLVAHAAGLTRAGRPLQSSTVGEALEELFNLKQVPVTKPKTKGMGTK